MACRFLITAWTVLAVSGAGCTASEDANCDPAPTTACPNRLDDKTGYAELVCQYAVENGYDYPDVGALTIVSIEKGSVAAPGSEYGTDRYQWARLDCCFAG